jgi:tetratricopeptide (TPR) repeat protein
LNEAEADFRTAIAALNNLHHSDPSNVDVVVKIASLYNELGKLSLRLGDFHQTFLAHLEARALLLEQPAAMRSDSKLRFELARSTVLLASIDVRSGTDSGPGSPPPPPEHSDHGGPPPGDGPPPRPLKDQQGRPHPPHADGRSPGPNNGGRRHGPPMFEEFSDRLRDAMPKVFKPGRSVAEGLAIILKEACDELRALGKESPDNVVYRFRLAQTLRIQLVNSATAGDAVVSRQSFLEGRELLNQLVARYPDDPKYLFELAHTLTQAARAGTDDEARESLERAVELGKQLFERFPSATEYQLLYGTALARLASNQAARDLDADSEKNLTRSIEVLTPLAVQFPDQGIIQIPLAKTCQQLGDLLREMAAENSSNSHYLERSRKELQSAIDRFEAYLSAPNENLKASEKGMFNNETCSSLYKSLAQTLTQLQLPEQAEQARASAARYTRPGRPPR